jgi:hypothetical protein
VGGASIGSALGHIWRQKEIMIGDHGSTDGTLASARQFESNEVRLATQPNQAAAAARVPSAGDTANPDELKDDPGKYDHLEELAERFFAAKRHHPSGTTAPAALNTHSFELPVIATDVGSLRNDIMETRTGFLCRAKNPADLTRTIKPISRVIYMKIWSRVAARFESLPMSGTRGQA